MLGLQLQSQGKGARTLLGDPGTVPATPWVVRTAGTGCWALPGPPRSPVTHEGRQAVRREAGAPKLHGVRHTVGEGLSGGAAREAACAPAVLRTPLLTRG